MGGEGIAGFRDEVTKCNRETARGRPGSRDQASQGPAPVALNRAAAGFGATARTSGTRRNEDWRLVPGEEWRSVLKAGTQAAPTSRAGEVARSTAAAARASTAWHRQISISNKQHITSAINLAKSSRDPSTGRNAAACPASRPAKGAKDGMVLMVLGPYAQNPRSATYFIALSSWSAKADSSTP